MIKNDRSEKTLSQARLKANRENALKSTGPKTEEGKGICARNAVKHGLRANKLLVPEESQREFNAMALGLRGQIQPVGEIEEFLVDRLIAAAWRMRRAHEIEAVLLAQDPYSRSLENRFRQCAEQIKTLGRYETLHEKAFYRALAEIEKLQVRRTLGSTEVFSATTRAKEA